MAVCLLIEKIALENITSLDWKIWTLSLRLFFSPPLPPTLADLKT